MLSEVRAGLNRPINVTKLFSTAPKPAAINNLSAYKPTVTSLVNSRTLSSSIPVHFIVPKHVSSTEFKSSKIKGVSTFQK